jgi:hypothetical protein
MTNYTRDMLKAQAEAARDFLTLAKAHLDDDIDESHDPETCDICSQYTGSVARDWSACAEDALIEYPLEVVNEVGTLLAVVISTGGPHIAIEQDKRWDQSARLQCYWGGEHYTLSDKVFDWAMDYFIGDDE